MLDLPVRFERAANARFWNLAGFDAEPRADQYQAIADANFRESMAFYFRLESISVKSPLPLGAPDAEIVQFCARRSDEVQRVIDRSGRDDIVRIVLERMLDLYCIDMPEVKSTKELIARCLDPIWWRRQIRKIHCRAFEHVAIDLGFVSAAAGKYCSDESLRRRAAQNARNAATLDGTTMQNELDQQFKLAELAALGVSNKAIRRGELMTRIAGFDRIAEKANHAGEFVTVTCPSRFHAMRRGDRVEFNPKWDHSTPKEAQAYLTKTWAKVRAKLAREGIAVYGFRIAEPHHDGCPHWHLLLFMEQEIRPGIKTIPRFRAIMRRYFLADSASEAGAKKNRVKFVAIDREKFGGGAAGYIAKYVAKNIDGYQVGEDLYGDPAIESSARVEAWSATWGIRQFQQIGGAPIGIWRELRRIKADTVRIAPPELIRAWQAAQKGERDSGRADFAEFVEACGGAFVGRDTTIKLEKKKEIEPGRYGLVEKIKPIGIIAVRFPNALFESVRHVWKRIESRAARVFESVFAFPWTRVNNCTLSIEPGALVSIEKKHRTTMICAELRLESLEAFKKSVIQRLQDLEIAQKMQKTRPNNAYSVAT